MGLGAGSPTLPPPCQAGQSERGLISQGGGSCFLLELVLEACLYLVNTQAPPVGASE